MNGINLLDFKFIGTYVQDSLGLVRVVILIIEIAGLVGGKWLDFKRAR